MKHTNHKEMVAALTADKTELANKLNTPAGRSRVMINMIEMIRCARVMDMEKALMVYDQRKDVNLEVEKVFGQTPKTINEQQAHLYHALILKFTEVGEMFEALADNICNGKPLNITNVIEELGDDEFATEMIRQELELERVDILQSNMDKLNARQPTGKFDKESAVARADKK